MYRWPTLGAQLLADRTEYQPRPEPTLDDFNPDPDSVVYDPTPTDILHYTDARDQIRKLNDKEAKISISLFTAIKQSVGPESQTLGRSGADGLEILLSGDPFRYYQNLRKTHEHKTSESSINALHELVCATNEDGASLESFLEQLRTKERTIRAALGTAENPDLIKIELILFVVFLQSLPPSIELNLMKEQILGDVQHDAREINVTTAISKLIAYANRLQMLNTPKAAIGDALAAEHPLARPQPKVRLGYVPVISSPRPTPHPPAPAQAALSFTYPDGSKSPILLASPVHQPTRPYCLHCWNALGMLYTNHVSTECSRRHDRWISRPSPTPANAAAHAANKLTRSAAKTARAQALACERAFADLAPTDDILALVADLAPADDILALAGATN
jgi:hypothetical protein